MIQYKFIPQKGNNPKVKGIGVLSIHEKEAIFFEGKAEANSRILGVLSQPEIKFLTSQGICLKGFEHIGYEKDGRKKFRYMEWYCPFVKQE